MSNLYKVFAPAPQTTNSKTSLLEEDILWNASSGYKPLDLLVTYTSPKQDWDISKDFHLTYRVVNAQYLVWGYEIFSNETTDFESNIPGNEDLRRELRQKSSG